MYIAIYYWIIMPKIIDDANDKKKEGKSFNYYGQECLNGTDSTVR